MTLAAKRSSLRIGDRRGRGILLATALTLMTIELSTTAQADDAPAADLPRGDVLYALCTQCHASNGAGNSEVLAPAIAGMPAWYIERQLVNFKSGIRGLHAEDDDPALLQPAVQRT